MIRAVHQTQKSSLTDDDKIRALVADLPKTIAASRRALEAYGNARSKDEVLPDPADPLLARLAELQPNTVEGLLDQASALALVYPECDDGHEPLILGAETPTRMTEEGSREEIFIRALVLGLYELSGARNGGQKAAKREAGLPARRAATQSAELARHCRALMRTAAQMLYASDLPAEDPNEAPLGDIAAMLELTARLCGEIQERCSDHGLSIDERREWVEDGEPLWHASAA